MGTRDDELSSVVLFLSPRGMFEGNTAHLLGSSGGGSSGEGEKSEGRCGQVKKHVCQHARLLKMEELKANVRVNERM